MTDRPGGWVGDKWVAMLLHLEPTDRVETADGYLTVEDALAFTEYDSFDFLAVRRWADGSTPEPPKRLPDVTELPEWHRFTEGLGLDLSVDPHGWLHHAASALIAAVDSRGEN